MNPRTTGVLLLVAAALGAFVYFYEIRGEEGRREAEEREKRLFAGVEAEAIEWLAFTTTDGTALRAERREGGWSIVEPVTFPGDSFALDGMASALAELASDAVYDAPQPLEVYGLASPEHDLRFAAGGTERALRTGDDTPMGSHAYALVVGETAVHTIPAGRKNALRKGLDDLRDKRILSFDTASVERVVVEWPDGRVELARDGEAWRLTAPLDGPADAAVVRDLLSDLAFLRATGFEDAPSDADEAGFAPAAWRAELFLASEEEGGEPRRLGLAIGSAVEDEVRLVRSGQPSLYRIAADRLADFPSRVSAYRFKQLADFEALDARRLELRFRDADGEPVAITASRTDAGWQAEPEPMAPEKIARLVDELSQLRADDILAERVGPDELAGLDLDPARATLLVYGEGEGEAARLAEVRIGATRGDEGIVAQSAENPQLFQLAPELAEHVPVSLEAFRNRFLVAQEEEVEVGGEPFEEAPPPDIDPSL
jgi:hypothetical protein